MGDVYGNVNVNYSYCKSVAQLKSAADYICKAILKKTTCYAGGQQSL